MDLQVIYLLSEIRSQASVPHERVVEYVYQLCEICAWLEEVGTDEADLLTKLSEVLLLLATVDFGRNSDATRQLYECKLELTHLFLELSIQNILKDPSVESQLISQMDTYFRQVKAHDIWRMLVVSSTKYVAKIYEEMIFYVLIRNEPTRIPSQYLWMLTALHQYAWLVIDEWKKTCINQHVHAFSPPADLADILEGFSLFNGHKPVTSEVVSCTTFMTRISDSLSNLALEHCTSPLMKAIVTKTLSATQIQSFLSLESYSAFKKTVFNISPSLLNSNLTTLTTLLADCCMMYLRSPHSVLALLVANTVNKIFTFNQEANLSLARIDRLRSTKGTHLRLVLSYKSKTFHEALRKDDFIGIKLYPFRPFCAIGKIKEVREEMLHLSEGTRQFRRGEIVVVVRGTDVPPLIPKQELHVTFPICLSETLNCIKQAMG